MTPKNDRLLRALRRGYKPDFSAVLEPRDAEQVSGAALLVRAGVFGAQPVFDERFFIFYEEVDLCLRARQGGPGRTDQVRPGL